jgi:hypothetical protein
LKLANAEAYFKAGLQDIFTYIAYRKKKFSLDTDSSKNAFQNNKKVLGFFYPFSLS